MRLNWIPQRLVQLARSQRQSVSGGVLALSLALSSSCDDGIGHPIEARASHAGASHAGASARSTVVAIGARAATTTATATGSGNSGAASTTTGSGGSGATSATIVSDTAVLVGGSASGGSSNQITLVFDGAGGLSSVRSTRTTVSECNTGELWPDQWATNEDMLAALITLYRVAGVECGKENPSGSSMAILDLDDPLRCFARQRSVSRSRNEQPATVAGFESAVVVERETDVDTTGADLFIDLWYGTDLTDCGTIMSKDFQTMEVGYAALSGRAYWTIALR